MKKLISLIILGMIFLTGCGTTASYTNISKVEYNDMLNNQGDYVFIDVRTPEEYAEDGIDDIFINIDSSVAVDEITSNYDKDDNIVLVCRSGNRSSQVAKGLVNNGFTNVYNVEYGLSSIK